MRKIIQLLSGLLFLVLQSSFAQDTSSLQRVPYKLHIDVNKQTSYDENLPAARFVNPNKSVQLYPGETVYLEAELTAGQISKLRAVPAIRDSSKTILISFTQSSKKRVHELMMLKVINPFSQTLSYKAMILLLNQKKWEPTSILPVPAGLTGYETWQDIIISIGIGGWTLE